MEIQPVGIIKSSIGEPSLTAGNNGIERRESAEGVIARQRAQRQKISEIIIEKKWNELLDGIEGFSHLLVLYWAHLVPEESRSLKKVHPMGRKENPLTGIFATRSPARPNPVLMTVVQLISRDKNTLTVTGLDAVDGSPVVDIKPYVPETLSGDEVRIPEWMERILRESHQEETD